MIFFERKRDRAFEKSAYTFNDSYDDVCVSRPGSPAGRDVHNALRFGYPCFSQS